jgi:iron complex outermembrane recepter protein
MRNRVQGIFAIIIMLIMMMPAAVANHPEQALGRISGHITDQAGNALAGAGIVVRELNVGTTANADGFYEIKNLRRGVYTLQVLHLGFISQSRLISLESELQEADFMMTPTHIELREVIVQESATGVVNPEKSLNITVAGGDFFSSSATVTMIQSLQRIPGINSMDIGTGISKPLIRGLGFNRLVVAQNNIKQQGQQWGADHGLEIDGYDVDRVEILKGPASLIYGSDAIGGALNIRPPVVPQENSLQAQVTAAAHSNNDLLGGSVMAALNRDGYFARVRFSRQDYADYRVPAESFTYNRWVLPIAEGRLKNTSGDDYAVSVTSGLHKPWGVSAVTASVYNQVSGFFPASHGIPDPASLLQVSSRRTPGFPQQWVRHTRLVSNSSVLLGNKRLELDLGFQQNHRQELDASPTASADVELELILNTFSANIKYHHLLSQRTSLLLGTAASLQQNRRGGYNFLLPDFMLADLGLFSVIQHSVQNNFFLNAGLRVDVATLSSAGYREQIRNSAGDTTGFTVRAVDLERNYSNLAFSTGASWLPDDRVNIKLNMGSSFRNPTPVELSANGIHHGSFRHEMGDTTLTPERAYQLDAGFTYQLQEFYFHLSPFVNYFTNFLFLNPSGVFSPLPGAGQIYRFQQAQAIHLGGEIYSDWHITHELHSSVGAEWVWAQNLNNNYPLPFTPPASIVGELNYTLFSSQATFSSLKLISSVRSVAAQNRVAQNERPTHAYTLAAAGLSLKLGKGQMPVEILFMVNNIFNTHYKNHISFYRILELPEPGRNFTIKLTAGFQKREN